MTAVPLYGTEASEESASSGEKDSHACNLLRKALLCCVVMAVVDVVASVVLSAAGPPPSAAVTPTCAFVGTAAAYVRGLSCVSGSGEGWALSQPAYASTASVERRPEQANGCASVAAAAVWWIEPGATARSYELD